jgi:hypothetical protein
MMMIATRISSRLEGLDRQDWKWKPLGVLSAAAKELATLGAVGAAVVLTATPSQIVAAMRVTSLSQTRIVFWTCRSSRSCRTVVDLQQSTRCPWAVAEQPAEATGVETLARERGSGGIAGGAVAVAVKIGPMGTIKTMARKGGGGEGTPRRGVAAPANLTGPGTKEPVAGHLETTRTVPSVPMSCCSARDADGAEENEGAVWLWVLNCMPARLL